MTNDPSTRPLAAPDQAEGRAPRIGILDSGVGGLSVLREIRQLLPDASSYHYVGDSDWCPYGNKAPSAIQERVVKIAEHLVAEGAGLLVVACNSATIHAVELLRVTFPLPVAGMEPGVKPAAEKTRSGVVGVFATEASIAGERFHQLVSTHADGVRVITRPCPRFVELVEAGELSGPEVEKAVAEALDPLLAAGADRIVLGCTHYPFLLPEIERQCPEGVSIIDTGPAVARRVAALLGREASETTEPGGKNALAGQSRIRIETTGPLERLEQLLPALLPGVEAKIGEAEF